MYRIEVQNGLPLPNSIDPSRIDSRAIIFYSPLLLIHWGVMLTNYQDSRSVAEEDHEVCSSCGNGAGNEKVTKPEPSMAVILMAGIGGLLAFFGLSFGLVAAVAEPGFLIVCLVACAIAVSLFVMAYAARRRQIGEWERAEEIAVASARCAYCDSQNPKGAQKCESCGAPL